MLLYLIPTIIVFVCIAVIAWIAVPKFPRVAIINIESIAKEREIKVINRIMLERLRRHWQAVYAFFTTVFGPMAKNVGSRILQYYRHLLELEKMSRTQPLRKLDIGQEITDKLALAEKNIAEGKYDQAEELCIDVIELDRHNLTVYEMLADMYVLMKEYKKSRETLRFLLKLLQKQNGEADKHRLANCFSNLGWVYQLEHRYQYALANFKKAVELEPSNPRFLDLLLKISIIVRNKNLARQVFHSMRQADPDNQKLPELKAEIDTLPDQVENTVVASDS